jgi:aryl-alcohol dehydrogenase-like predicted oxidoreductase
VGIDMAHLALAWTIRQPGITCVLIGARNLAQVDQAFEAESIELSPELRTQLNQL